MPDLILRQVSEILSKNMKENDPILIEKEGVLKVFGFIHEITPDKISIGAQGWLDRGTMTFHLKRPSKLTTDPIIIENVKLGSQEDARNGLERCHYLDLLRDEIYFFFNNDPKKDHLDPNVIDGATKEISLEELETIVKVLIPYKRGEYGFTTLEQVKEQAKNLGCIGSLVYYNGEE